MWFPTRHVSLIAVVVLVILLLLIGKVEGLSSGCQTTLDEYDATNKTYVKGD